MMKKIVLAISVFFLVLLIFYTLLPAPSFPAPPYDSFQSVEPADTETTLRRAYFTNFTREEVMNLYSQEMSFSPFFNLPLPTYSLNYPPEDAFSLIRDQTRSTFLQEVVHPLRESVFVNGFEPKLAKDEIWYKGFHYRQKITIRYVPSNVFVRVLVVLLSSVGIILIAREWTKTAKWIFR